MHVSQKINCHLSTDETLFAQIIKMESQVFAAQLSSVQPRGTRQAQKLYQWLACADSKTAIAVFETIIAAVEQQCESLGGRRLSMVSNPDGWLLVSKVQQKQVVGEDVAIVLVPPEGLVR